MLLFPVLPARKAALSPELAFGGVHHSAPSRAPLFLSRQIYSPVLCCLSRHDDIILKLLHWQPVALFMPKCSRDISSSVKKGAGGKESNKINEIRKRKSL